MQVGEARVYAEALFDYAKKAGKLDEAAKSMAVLVEIADKTPSFVPYFSNPTVSGSDKKRVVASLLLSPDFFAAWAEATAYYGALGSLRAIDERFGELLDGERGVERVTVYSASPLKEEEKESLLTALGGKSRFRLHCKVDPSLIGGYRLYVDGRLIDRSLKGRVEAIASSLRGKEGI